MVPSASEAVASVLARWFTNEILRRKLIQNLKGEYVFSVLRSQWELNTGRIGATEKLKECLKDYGFKIIFRRSEVLIIKFR